MKKANISTIKNKLSQYLKYVREGESIRIFDRNEAVADLVPVGKKESSNHLSRLEAKGIVRKGAKKLPSRFLSSLEIEEGKTSGVLEALLEERKSGR